MKKTLIWWGGAVALMVWGFNRLLFAQLPFIFRDPYEDMSFGWYIPIFSAYVIWTERRKIVESLGQSSVIGVLAMLPFLFFGFLGMRGTQPRFGVLAFAGLMVTVPWALYGFRTAKRMMFPAAFTLFCIPLSNYLDTVTVYLRLFAISISHAVMTVFGVDVIRNGTALMAADGSFSIDVAAPCSGLRSIFALTALTVGYAYFNQRTWLRRAALMACAIPLAIAGNVARVLSICAVATLSSPDFATGFYHDYSGYVVFMVAILLMVACGEVISKIGIKKA